MTNSVGPLLSLIIALVRVNSCSAFIVSILAEARNRCLTCCGSPEMNAHVNQHSGNGPPTNWASHHSAAKNLSTVSSGWSYRVMNWSYALNASVAYAVMRVRLICSVSAFCSTLYILRSAKLTHKLHIFDPLDNGHVSRSTTKLRNQLDVKYLALHCWKVVYCRNRF